ncbi:MAG: hypothetical protein ACXVRS_16195 [Gaiellaceae bacterium]
MTAAASHDEDLWALRRPANAHRLRTWMFSVMAHAGSSLVARARKGKR